MWSADAHSRRILLLSDQPPPTSGIHRICQVRGKEQVERLKNFFTKKLPMMRRDVPTGPA